MHPITAGSLFTGIGGLDLGFERAGIHSAFQVECDRGCRHILRRHFPNATRFADVRTVGAHNLQPVDIIHGGFPCQNLSKAGRGAGLAGARSGLWFEFHRIVSELKPAFVAIENVFGLLSQRHRSDFGTIIQGLGDSGYRVAYRIIDSQFFLPQRRKRLFIIASLGNLRCAEILPEPEGMPETGAPAHDTPAAPDLGICSAEAPVVTSGPQMFDQRGVHRERMSTTVTPTLTCYEQPMLVRPELRQLTPTECERLQGFTDNWTQWGLDQNGKQVEMTDRARYRQLGNAVSVPVAEWIAKRIKRVITESTTEKPQESTKSNFQHRWEANQTQKPTGAGVIKHTAHTQYECEHQTTTSSQHHERQTPLRGRGKNRHQLQFGIFPQTAL